MPLLNPMKKANVEKKVGSLKVRDGSLTSMAALASFPLNPEMVAASEKHRDLRGKIQNKTNSIEEYEMYIKNDSAILAELEQELADLTDVEIPVASEKEVKGALEKVAQLPWVENVEAYRDCIVVTTRAGELVTPLYTRYVYFPGGDTAREFMENPVYIPLPKYQLWLNTNNMGRGGWGNNQRNFSIQLVAEEDVTKFVDNPIFNQDVHQHWASEGRGGFLNYDSMCLGEYEEEFKDASCKGYAELCSKIAEYLQNSGDTHAYRNKENWALSLGKGGYHEAAFRQALPGETIEAIETTFKERYKENESLFRTTQTGVAAGIAGGVAQDRAIQRVTLEGGWMTFERPGEVMQIQDEFDADDLLEVDDDEDDED